MGFTEVLGLRLELTSAGLVTGLMKRKNCYGEENPTLGGTAG
jgi:hypothetical protein